MAAGRDRGDSPAHGKAATAVKYLSGDAHSPAPKIECRFGQHQRWDAVPDGGALSPHTHAFRYPAAVAASSVAKHRSGCVAAYHACPGTW